MSHPIYLKEKNRETRWASFENPRGEKGQGGRENGGAKGRAFRSIEPGTSQILMQAEGPGTVDRIWMTLSDRSPQMLRALRLDMYWDGAEKPAVSAPVGDFFAFSFGVPVKFESAFLSNPEGRSFNSFFPMPFRKSAKIVITNESTRRIDRFFYDVCYSLRPLEAEALYFHAFWNRENPTKLCQDYTILPKLSGEGAFVGVHLAVQTNPGYGDSWFGEGEVKVYLDGDEAYPTLCGTGTEDYIGSAWGQGHYAHRAQGSLVADPEGGRFSFYRFHVADPICFHRDIKVQIQTIGGGDKNKVLNIIDRGLPVKVVSGDNGNFEQLYEKNFVPCRESKEAWYNYYREDDFSSTAYFYYGSPASSLPELSPLETRIADLRG
jgi:hypothetical protein